MFIFPVQLTTSRIGNLTRLIHTLLYVMTIHTWLGHFYLYFIFFSEEKFQLLPGFELTSQRVRRLRGYQLSYRGDLLNFVALGLGSDDGCPSATGRSSANCKLEGAK